MPELDTPSYEDHLELWSRFDSWLLTSACSLYTGGPPAYSDQDHPNPLKYAVLYEAAISCAGGTLVLVDASAQVADYRVAPSVFASWAATLNVVPYSGFQPKYDSSLANDQWANADDLKDIKEIFEKETGHRLPQGIAAKLRAFSEKAEAKVRCRAMADYLWSLDEGKSSTEIISDPLFRTFGLKGRRYSNRQMRDWISGIHPNPKPGRPKKHSRQPN